MNEMAKEEIKYIKKAVENHKEEDNIKKLSRGIAESFKAFSNEQKNSGSESLITNDNIIDQGKKVEIEVPIVFLNHTEYLKFETTEAGLNYFETLLNPNKEKKELDRAEEIENLTFIDGVLLTWNIFNKILNNRLKDENGDPEKGICQGHSYEYLGIINDDIAEFILDKVLEQGYLKNRGDHLHDLFIMKSKVYERPTWMKNQKDEELKIEVNK